MSVNSNQPENTATWVVLGILLLFLAFGLLPFVPEIRLFNILWMVFFAITGIGAICYALIVRPKLQRANWYKRELFEAMIAYDVAYKIVPNCIFGEIAQNENLLKECLSDAQLAQFLYCTHSESLSLEPNYAVRSEYQTRHGKLDVGTPYVLFQFPKRKLSPEECFILAPFFSCIIRPESTMRIEYYVLGERPTIPGDLHERRPKTTFRSVSRDGINANLGPGPEPTAELFLEHIVEYRKRWAVKNEEPGI